MLSQSWTVYEISVFGPARIVLSERFLAFEPSFLTGATPSSTKTTRSKLAEAAGRVPTENPIAIEMIEVQRVAV